MTSEVQFYKQPPGACRPTGEVLEPGWYWVRMREALSGPMPTGSEVGPFKTKREAERAYRKGE